MRSTISQTLLGLAVLLCLISFVSATYTDSPVVTRRKVLRKRAGGKCSAATTKTTSTVNGSPTSTTAPVLSATEGTGSDDGATTSTLPNNNQHVVITTSKPASSTSTSAATSTSTSTTTLGSGSGSGYVSGWTEGNGPFSGQGTWYNTMGGYGACGSILSDTIPYAAVSTMMYDSWPGAGANPNLNPICQDKFAKVTYSGKSVVVKIVDRCEGCAKYDIDLTPVAYDQLADPGLGRMAVTWEFVASASG